MSDAFWGLGKFPSPVVGSGDLRRFDDDPIWVVLFCAGISEENGREKNGGKYLRSLAMRSSSVRPARSTYSFKYMIRRRADQRYHEMTLTCSRSGSR